MIALFSWIQSDTVIVPVSDEQEVNVNNDGPCFRQTRGGCEQWWSLFPVSDEQEVDVNKLPDPPAFSDADLKLTTVQKIPISVKVKDKVSETGFWSWVMQELL